MHQYIITPLDFGLWKNRHRFSTLLQGKISFDRKTKNAIRIGWGHKKSGKRAKFLATIFHQPYLLLEDGFLRSLGLGVDGYPPLSMVVDKLGIYYDTTRPSTLEQLVLTGECDEVLAEKAR